MTATTRDQAAVAIEGGGVELRMQEIGGDMTTAFVRLPAGADKFAEDIDHVRAQSG